MANAKIHGIKLSALMITTVLLSGCVSQWDMQGHDPKDYYAKHPIQNKVETRFVTTTVHFYVHSDRLSDEEIDGLQAALRDVSPPAVETVRIQLSPSQSGKLAREEYLIKLLRTMGYSRKQISFEPSDALQYSEAKLDVTYAAVVPPHCPDWRTSPVTSFSNTREGNFGCAQVVNTGLMVADPRDLERGTGDVPYDAARSAKGIDDYKNNKDFMPATIGAGGGSVSGSSSSSTSGGTGAGSTGVTGQ